MKRVGNEIHKDTCLGQQTPMREPDGAKVDLEEHFSEEEIVELAIICAKTYGMDKFAISTQVRTWTEACAIHPQLNELA